MKSTQKLLILLTIIFSFPTTSMASHLVGGQIRWECLSNGKYVFYMEIYRECTGTSFSFTTQSLQILNSNMPSIAMKPDTNLFNFYGNGNISPKGSSGCQKICSANGGISDLGAMQFFPFVSDPVKLTGTPPTSGWVFHWSSCCRPSTVKNLTSPASQGFGLIATMYPNGSADAFPCYDSSPEFYELPNTTVPRGAKYSLSMAAKDVDADSLMYFLDAPLDASASGNTFSPNAVYYTTGYNKNSPFPDTSFHPDNIPARFDTVTGHIEGRIESGQIGWLYAYSIRVDSYRDGIKIASIWRDAPLQLHESNYKAPTFKFNGITSKNYQLTVEAGDSIQLPIQLLDSNFFPDTNNPGIIRARDIAMQYSGLMFSRDFSDPDNCSYANFSCANIVPAPLYDSVFFMDYVSRDSANLNIQFNWNTSCDLLRLSDSKRFTFLFKSVDDQCPPEISYAALNIDLRRYQPEIKQMGNTLSVEAGSDSYQWFFNDTLIHNSDTNSIQMQISGKYAVEVVRNGCSSVRESAIVFAVGMEENSLEDQLYVYPNPFNNSFTIEFSDKLPDPIKVQLTDINGKEIAIFPKRQMNKIILENRTDLSTGIYLLNISAGDHQIYRKLIKH